MGTFFQQYGVEEARRNRIIRNIILSCVGLLVLGIIGSFQVFTQALIVGGTTGDPLSSTLMFMVLIYNNAFRYFQMGYAAALSVVLFVAIMLATLVIFRTARAWVYYEGAQRAR